MKMKIVFFLSILLLSGTSLAYTPSAPCDKYSCYDVSSSNFACPEGLVKTRGWCTGPKNIMMCGPPGIPVGPYLRTQAGIDIRNKIYVGTYTQCAPESQDSQEVKISDFGAVIDGDTDCSYKVENNGKTTRDWTSVSCDSKVDISVKHGGDCEESGSCTVYSDGGSFGAAHIVDSHTVSVTKCKAPYETYDCMSTQTCKSKGMKSKSGFCPGPPDFQCCLSSIAASGTSSDADAAQENSFIIDNANLLTNEDSIQGIVTNLFESKNIQIAIETDDQLGSDPATMLSTKFRDAYKLRSIGTPALNILVIYGKKENKFLLGHARDCGYSNAELESAINNAKVKSDIQKQNYNSAFLALSYVLTDLANSKDSANINCFTQSKEQSCSQGCGSFFSSCTKDSCEQLGCSFNEKFKICIDADIVESRGSITEHLNAVKNGFRGFISKDPLTKGANCAGYVVRSSEYIFGIGKHFITGLSGNAWDLPKSIQDHGGSVTWYDWRKGEIFTNYDSLNPGDIIGFHYTDSDYLPSKKGGELGNSPDIDFTHVALYLGKQSNKHIITHLYHPPKQKVAPERIEPIEDFLSQYGDKFKIRVIMRPDQERLYRSLPPDYSPDFKSVKINKGDLLLKIVPGSSDLEKEVYAWITSDINSMAENVNLDGFVGMELRIPQSLPKQYAYNSIMDEKTQQIEDKLTGLINQRKIEGKINQYNAQNPEYWAKLIVDNSQDKSISDIALIASIIESESSFTNDPKNGWENILRPLDQFTFKTRSWSMGPMNVQTCTAEQLSKDSGRNDDVWSSLATREGGIYYGTRLLQKIENDHEIKSGTLLDDDKIMEIWVDYIKKPFFLRNVILQAEINDLLTPQLMREATGSDSIKQDGWLRVYESTNPCKQTDTLTKSEMAIRKVVDVYKLPISQQEISDALSLENKKEFETTNVFSSITDMWMSRFGTSSNQFLRSNTISYFKPSPIKLSVSERPPGSIYRYEISSLASVLENPVYHVITYKIQDLQGNELVPETKKDCGSSMLCSSFVNFDDDIGVLQYWVNVGISSGEDIRMPATGVSSEYISSSGNCNGVYSSFKCLDKNTMHCNNGNFVKSYCTGPENIQCCVTTDKAVSDSGDSVAIASISSSGDFYAVLTNPKNFCKDIGWNLRSSSGIIISTGKGASFTAKPPVGYDYTAEFFCPKGSSAIKTTDLYSLSGPVSIAHPEIRGYFKFMTEINSNQPGVTPRMDIYKYYSMGLA